MHRAASPHRSEDGTLTEPLAAGNDAVCSDPQHTAPTPMALNDTDRRRLLLATAVTLVALPALWWANTSADSAAPNVAVAGVDVGTDPNEPGLRSDSTELGSAEPVFLGGPSSKTGAGQQVIAVPAKPSVEGITARATFRSSLPSADSCIVPGLAGGARVTVVNTNNNRTIVCTTISVPDGADDVVLDTATFAKLADLTSAPIAVEIRQ